MKKTISYIMTCIFLFTSLFSGSSFVFAQSENTMILKLDESAQIVNNGTKEEKILLNNVIDGSYRLIIFNSNGTTEQRIHTVSETSFILKSGSRAVITVKKLKKDTEGLEIVIPEGDLSLEKVGYPAFEELLLEIGKNYEFVNTSEYTYSIDFYAWSNGSFDYSLYRTEGSTITGLNKILDPIKINPDEKIAITIKSISETNKDGGLKFYLPYDCFVMKESSEPALLNAKLKAGESFEFINNSSNEQIIVNDSYSKGEYDCTIYDINGSARELNTHSGSIKLSAQPGERVSVKVTEISNSNKSGTIEFGAPFKYFNLKSTEQENISNSTEAEREILSIKSNSDQIILKKGEGLNVFDHLNLIADYSDGTSKNLNYEKGARLYIADKGIVSEEHGDISGLKKGTTTMTISFEGLEIKIGLIVNETAEKAKTPEVIKVDVNNETLGFDVPPQIINGRTMVPLRGILEALDVYILWDNETKTVTGIRGNNVIILTIDKPNGEVDGIPVKLDAPAVIKDGRTLVPARFIAESLGAKVTWDEKEKKVKITDNGVSPDTKVKVYDALYGTQSECVSRELPQKLVGDSTGLWVVGGMKVKIYDSVTGKPSECYGWEIANKVAGDSTGKWVTEGMPVFVYDAVTGTPSKCYGIELESKISGDNTGRWVSSGMIIPVYDLISGKKSECLGLEIASKLAGDGSGKWATADMVVPIYSTASGKMSYCKGNEIEKKIKGDSTGSWLTEFMSVKIYDSATGISVRTTGGKLSSRLTDDGDVKCLTSDMTVTMFRPKDYQQEKIYAKDISLKLSQGWTFEKPEEKVVTEVKEANDTALLKYIDFFISEGFDKSYFVEAEKVNEQYVKNPGKENINRYNMARNSYYYLKFMYQNCEGYANDATTSLEDFLMSLLSCELKIKHVKKLYKNNKEVLDQLGKVETAVKNIRLKLVEKTKASVNKTFAKKGIKADGTVEIDKLIDTAISDMEEITIVDITEPLQNKIKEKKLISKAIMKLMIEEEMQNQLKVVNTYSSQPLSGDKYVSRDNLIELMLEFSEEDMDDTFFVTGSQVFGKAFTDTSDIIGFINQLLVYLTVGVPVTSYVTSLVAAVTVPAENILAFLGTGFTAGSVAGAIDTIYERINYIRWIPRKAFCKT